MAEEKTYERKLVEAVKRAGGIALKQTSQYHRGIPDRLVILPGGRTDWVELKSDGRKPTKLQMLTHDQLRSLGQKVWLVDSRESLQEYIDTL